jgi:26S proteasome regulatory subunit N1
MAQDGEQSKPVDKGKGKAVDGEPNKAGEVKKDKDGKPLVNGKAEEGIIGGENAWDISKVMANGKCSSGGAQ